jgi:adenosine deaminase
MTTPAADTYQACPKVELHRHLEGSLRLETLVDIARAHGIPILGTGHLRSLVQIDPQDPPTMENFLSKFVTLRLFYRSPEIIQRLAREAIADAARDNVRYLELRFTPLALSKVEKFGLAEVMDWVIHAIQAASQELGVKTRLIASVNRNESVETAEQVARLAAERIGRGVVALDLAGDEAGFSPAPFEGVFREARQSGLRVTAHAGEWAGAHNVAHAIDKLGAERIGHGVRVLEDPQVVELARQRGAAFEVCLTSNFQSGVVSELARHPLQGMLAAGLNVTLNTDDPSISGITLGDEYRIARQELGLSVAQWRGCILAAARAAFLPEAERQALVDSLSAELAQVTL